MVLPTTSLAIEKTRSSNAALAVAWGAAPALLPWPELFLLTGSLTRLQRGTKKGFGRRLGCSQHSHCVCWPMAGSHSSSESTSTVRENFLHCALLPLPPSGLCPMGHSTDIPSPSATGLQCPQGCSTGSAHGSCERVSGSRCQGSTWPLCAPGPGTAGAHARGGITEVEAQACHSLPIRQGILLSLVLPICLKELLSVCFQG